MNKPHGKPPRELMDRLIKEASETTGISISDICSLNHSKFIAPGRRYVWKALHAAGYGPSAIARAWGCDPSSVHNAVYGKRHRTYRGIKPVTASLAAPILAAWPAMDAKLTDRARPARA